MSRPRINLDQFDASQKPDWFKAAIAKIKAESITGARCPTNRGLAHEKSRVVSASPDRLKATKPIGWLLRDETYEKQIITEVEVQAGFLLQAGHERCPVSVDFHRRKLRHYRHDIGLRPNGAGEGQYQRKQHGTQEAEPVLCFYMSHRCIPAEVCLPG